MDRFQEPKQPKVHDYCEDCGGEIYEGQLATTLESDLFCNDRCLFNYLGAVTITAGEE